MSENHPSQQDYCLYRHFTSATNSDNSETIDDAVQQHKSTNRPRSVLLRKCAENGYGFTLRYFVIYPPGSKSKKKEDYSIECGDESDTLLRSTATPPSYDYNVSDDNQSSDASDLRKGEAMDTIFVKNVKKGSEADRAGLGTGDRIVSVNGQPVTGLPYADVIKLIQCCDGNLQMLVVPKEDDILQQYFSDSAYQHSDGDNQSVASTDTSECYSSVATRQLYSSPPVDGKKFATYTQEPQLSKTSIGKPLFHKPDLLTSHVTTASANPCSSSSNYNCETDTGTTTVPSSALSYLSTASRPCPPPYGYHQSRYYAKPSSINCSAIQTSDSVKPMTSPIWYSSTTHLSMPCSSASQEDTPHPFSSFTSSGVRSHSVDGGCSSFPRDIAYEHQSLVNRRKEEFLRNVSGVQFTPSTAITSGIGRSWFAGNLKSSSSDESKIVFSKTSSMSTKSSEGALNTICNIDSSVNVSKSGFGAGAPNQMWSSFTSTNFHENGINKNSQQMSQSVYGVNLNDAQTDVNNFRGPYHFDSTSTENNANNLQSNSSTRTTAEPADYRQHPLYKSVQVRINQHPKSRTERSFENILEDDTDRDKLHPLLVRKASSLDSELSLNQNLPVKSDDRVNHLQLVSQRAKQFECGSQMWEIEANNKRNLYKNELARITSRCKTPRVIERTAKYESMSGASSQETIASTGVTSEMRTSAELESKFSRHLAKMGIMMPNLISSLTPSTSSPSANNNNECRYIGDLSGAFDDSQDKKSRATRQNSYLTAINRDAWHGNNNDVDWYNVANKLKQQYRPLTNESIINVPNVESVRRTIGGSIKRSTSMSECTFDRKMNIARFSSLNQSGNRSSTTGHDLMINDGCCDLFGMEFESLLNDGAISNLIAAFDSMLAGVPVTPPPNTSSTSTITTNTPTSTTNTAGVVLRKKAIYESNSDEQNKSIVRRISYLRATSTESNVQNSKLNKRAGRIDVQSHDGAVEDSAKHYSTPKSSHGHSIQKLKSFFGERTPQIVEASGIHQHDESSATNAESTGTSGLDAVSKEGWLQCKVTLVDGKRASDRSWRLVWAVLRGHALYFYKDKKDSTTHLPVGSSDEHPPINVKSCMVDIAYDYTKKKHVFRLNTYGASEFLLQAEDNADMLRWIQTIQDNSNPDCDVKGIGSQDVILRKTSAMLSTASSDHQQLSVNRDHVSRLSPQPVHKSIMKLNFRTRSPTGHHTGVGSSVGSHFTTSDLPLPPSKTVGRKSAHQSDESSPKSKTWRGKVVKSLRKFQGSSLSSTPPQVEGSTIGVALDDCPATEDNEFVPLLVDICTKIVDNHGLEIVGIYRIPGNNASVAALQEAVNKGFDTLNLQDHRWSDVNVISSLLKSFFRQLPEPLFTSELYSMFIEANKLEDNADRLLTLKKLVHELPDHHYETLRHLMKHLQKVVENSDVNKMEARNLAIVFGPNLVRTADNNMVTMVTDMSHQCRIIETVLNNVDWFFSDDDGKSSFLPSSSVAESADEQTSNTNLLLGNIDRVEGMSVGHLLTSQSEIPLCTKEVVSNLINAANRKAAKMRTGKDFDERNIDHEVELRHQKFRRGSAPSESYSLKVGAAGAAKTEWMLKSDGSNDSTLSSSSRTFSSQTLSEDAMSLKSVDAKPSAESLHSSNEPSKSGNQSARRMSGGRTTGLIVSGNRFLPKSTIREPSSDPVGVVSSDSSANDVKDRYPVASIVAEDKSKEKSPPYTVLSPSTQERIKRFEAETKALLQRDLHARRSRQDGERQRLELDRQRIEMEWQRAKRDLEQDDFLDELADNPSDIRRRISDFAYKITDLNGDGNVAPSSFMVPPMIQTSDVTSDYSSSGTSPIASHHREAATSSRHTAVTSTSNYQASGVPPYNLPPSIMPQNKLPPIPRRYHRNRRKFPPSAQTSLRRGKSAESIVDHGRRPSEQQLGNVRHADADSGQSYPLSSMADYATTAKLSGSLDSLRKYYADADRVGKEKLNGSNSVSNQDGEDLLSSITSTLELQSSTSRGNPQYLSSLDRRKTGAADVIDTNHHHNPSLYRNDDDGPPDSESFGQSPDVSVDSARIVFRDPSLHRQNRPNNRRGIYGNEHFLLHFNKQNTPTDEPVTKHAVDSSSANNEHHDERVGSSSSADDKKSESTKDKRNSITTFRKEYTSLTATISPFNNTVKMSPSTTAILNVTCEEEYADGESPLDKDEKQDGCREKKLPRDQRQLSKRPTRPRHLRRRHTVSGTQELDKFRELLIKNVNPSKERKLSAWEQLRPVCERIPPLEHRSLTSWMKRERLRTSSPDLYHARQQSSCDGNKKNHNECQFSVVDIDIGDKTDRNDACRLSERKQSPQLPPLKTLESLV
ncbi:ARHGAP21 (predicted) [Pycnogonum litorale]